MSGQRGTLYAWPDDTIVANLAVGDTVPWTEVGEGITTAAGGYSISAATVPPAGTNMTLVAPGAAWNYTSDGSGTAQTVSLQMDPATAVDDANPTSPAVCNNPTVVRNYGQQWTTVASTWSIVTGVVMDTVYHSGQTSHLGVDFSATGVLGSWSASGSHDVSSNIDETCPATSDKSDTHYQTQFVDKEFRQICHDTTNYYAKPTSYAGGARETSAGAAPTATHCVFQMAGSSGRVSSSSAYTYSGGVGIGGLLGNAGVSAQTGCSTGAELTFTFNSGHDWCGTAGLPGQTPKRLVAGAG